MGDLVPGFTTVGEDNAIREALDRVLDGKLPDDTPLSYVVTQCYAALAVIIDEIIEDRMEQGRKEGRSEER